MAGSGIPLSVEFEAALTSGKLDEARALLDEEHESAITALRRAIELGWHTIPDARSDIAEFHLRAGRGEEAARIWAELKAEDPNDVWLYNGAGLSYNEVGEHELAVDWLGEGMELAIRDGDPERIVAQLSGVRRRSLDALERAPDEPERRADVCRRGERARGRTAFAGSHL
jgi:tetratricopeptide (TPR) repeat protein